VATQGRLRSPGGTRVKLKASLKRLPAHARGSAFSGHHHTRLDAEIAGVRCIGLNKVAMPGNLVALDFALQNTPPDAFISSENDPSSFAAGCQPDFVLRAKGKCPAGMLDPRPTFTHALEQQARMNQAASRRVSSQRIASSMFCVEVS
jgi:hypothetical protein